jgi:hypothetical protein
MKTIVINIMIVSFCVSVSSCTLKNEIAKSCSFSYSIEDPDVFRQDFISYKNALIQFKLLYKTNVEVDADIAGGGRKDGKENVKSATYSFDTVSVVVTMKESGKFYQFDKFIPDAKLLKYGKSDTASPEMKFTASPTQGNNISNPDISKAKDVTINNIPLKRIDSIVEIEGYKGTFSYYYLNDPAFLTVFNINKQIENIERKYCFVGYLFSYNEGKQSEGFLLTSLKNLDKKQTDICESLYKKVRNYK